jgi:nitroreductase
MRFDRPIADTIRSRRSVRTYSDEAIDAERMRVLREACSELGTAPFGEVARLGVVERPCRKGEAVRVSDYGLIKNPRYFLVGTITDSPTAKEDYGYLMEHLVLKATEVGLGTCWMGLFNREAFPDVRVGAGERFPAIVVTGVPTGRPRFGERVVRTMVRADRRLPWEELFFEGTHDRPLTREAAGRFAGPLDMLRLAPSAGNTQPWRVVRGRGTDAFHLYMRNNKRMYYERGLHNLDIGIAMSHLELAAREAGLEGGWRVEDPGLPAVPEATEYRVSWFAG